ncbi:hypothetical protein QJS10_CPA10g00040 [Acorus calamus]|uniref:Uncharacterized protein n=1 Tax=Acorus calamus TaxID=4465 RepID=A0AAV9E1J4_ACOCL|nr:hypothetical protein QJS10_CPA10g00040 [Acorus calamus]
MASSPTEKARADHKFDVLAVAEADPGRPDRTGRAQWLSLGANDGLLSTNLKKLNSFPNAIFKTNLNRRRRKWCCLIQ